MEEKRSRKSILSMQQRNKRAKTRPCVRSTRARGSSEVRLLRSPSSRVRPIGSCHDESRSAEAKTKGKISFLFAVSFAFLLFPFFLDTQKTISFGPFLNKKVFFLAKFRYFFDKEIGLLLRVSLFFKCPLSFF